MRICYDIAAFTLNRSTIFMIGKTTVMSMDSFQASVTAYSMVMHKYPAMTNKLDMDVSIPRSLGSQTSLLYDIVKLVTNPMLKPISAELAYRLIGLSANNNITLAMKYDTFEINMHIL